MRKLLSAIGRFLAELRRRKVYQVALAYVVVGFMVIEAADLTLVRLGLPPWTVTLVIVLVGLGFPIALVLAWALEVTPEGVRVEERASQEEARPAAYTTRDLWVGASVLALLLVGAWWMWVGVSSENSATDPSGGTQEVKERSIAVLPFEPLSSGEESETFARGVHDDLLTRLSNVGDLTVLSRTSVQKYRDTELSIPSIADTLGVRWIVEGGVLESGGQVQVNAQLIDPRTDAHRWAESYERELTAENLFAVQGEITREIADALHAQLTAGEQSRVTGAPTENLDAYRLYVKGRSQLDTRSAEGIRRAVDYFRQALRADSTFALVWSGLADAQGLSEYASDSLGAVVPSHEEAARRALELDPDLAEAHASMGYFYEEQQNAPAALHHLKRAVELKPSYAQAHHWLGFLQLMIGRPEKALRHLRRATELNPQNAGASAALVGAYVANEKPEEALREAQRLERIAPEGLGEGGTSTVVLALTHLGRHEQAKKVAREALAQADTSSDGDIRFHLAMAELAGGDESRARQEVAKTNDHLPRSRAMLHAALSELDAAFDILLEADFSRASAFVYTRYFYPDLLRGFREDPRYEELIRTINQAWGLNPDGSIPEDFEAPSTTEVEADA